MHRTPFSGSTSVAPRSYGEAVYLQQNGAPNLPYGLEVLCTGGKALNVEWDDAGNVELVSLRADAWEHALLAAITA